MFPRFQFKINDRIVIDSEAFVSEINGSVLHFKLEDSDTFPHVVDSELVAIGGWKLNAVSLIHSKANAKLVVNGWKSLDGLIPMDRLLIPFLYSTATEYIRFKFTGVEPSWTKLLRLCYWYEKCLAMNDKNYHYKQREIKSKILKPLRNTEKALNNKGRGFLFAMEQLNLAISSYTSELMFAALCNECYDKVSFDKTHDFILDTFPCESKSVYSRATVEQIEDGTPKLNIRGQIVGENVNLFEELVNFISSKKVLGHIIKAHNQGGRIIFLDATHTFASFLIQFITMNNDLEFSFDKALQNAFNLAKNTKEKLPVIVTSSATSYEHIISAFCIPTPMSEI